MEKSALQKARYEYKAKLPPAIAGELGSIRMDKGSSTESLSNHAELKQHFEKTYGLPEVKFISGESNLSNEAKNVAVILSGGQAPGGHNVIAGLFDALKNANSDSRLFGFLGGPAGILEDKAIEITGRFIDEYRNTGGFDMIGSGRTKIETEEQFEKALSVLKVRHISALVIIGGDDSNTNAALLAEYFEKKNAGIQIIGVPKTIDGDLKNQGIEVSFGFDTATKVYSELIGNIARDANSAKKYWHFIKLMGRSASHICLECALKTRPNIAIISEEVAAKQQTLHEIVATIVDTIVQRSENNENFGVVLVPEGLIEYIPEMKALIQEINSLLGLHSSHFSTLNTFEDQSEWINKNLSKDSSYVFSSLPNMIQRQLLMDRDPHGNVQVSRIETEYLLIDMVEDRLKEMKNEGSFHAKFSYQSHFLGYEGRAGFPSNFDADYCYSLGFTSFLLIAGGCTGYIASVQNLAQNYEKWEAGGIPLTVMMNMEMRKGKMKPVIQKALVDLNGKPFKSFQANRGDWAVKTSYLYPGAIQYFGPPEITDRPAESLILESQDR